MAAHRRAEIEALFEAALDRSPADREEWLRDATGADAELRAEVAALLAAHDRAAGILEVPNAALTQDTGQRLGAYRLIRPIGRGGMGTVYLAERDDGQFFQRAAIKLLRRGLDTTDLVRRFLAERQILATLQHPNIGRLLDGGVTCDGRPYLVMEYVDGEPIDLWCDRHRLPLEARLRLCCTVARAVQHAHRNLVVHRDLKPSNILVTADGEPKLLDFGIAKLIGVGAIPLLADETASGIRLMTPQYAAPEQIRGEAITTATDVYGLGVVLYQLLAGRRPYTLDGRSLREIDRIVCELEPPPPSAAPAANPAEEGDIGRLRGLRPRRLRRQLAGELDRIVLKALRKAPERRYQTADALADDIERYLDGRPGASRGESGAYRRRGRGPRGWRLAAGAALALLLAGYAVMATIGANRAREELRQSRMVQAEMLDALGEARARLGDSAAAAALLARSAALRRELQRDGEAPATKAAGR